MGFLSSIGKIAMRAGENFVTAVAQPISYVSNVAKDTIYGGKRADVQVQKYMAKPLGSQIAGIVVSAGTTAATIASAGAAGTALKAGTLGKSAVSVGKSLIPTTPKGKVVAAVGGIALGGALVKEPVATSKAIIKTPVSIANVGGNVASFIAEPSSESFKKIVQENPAIVAGAAGLTGMALARSLLPAVSAARQTEAIQEQTEAIKGLSNLPVAAGQQTPSFTPESSLPVAAASQTPVTPATRIVTTGTTGTRKYSRKPQKPSIINQKVNVMVSNRSNSIGFRNTYRNKNYLNRELLYN